MSVPRIDGYTPCRTCAGSLRVYLTPPEGEPQHLSTLVSKNKCGLDVCALRCVLLTALEVAEALQFMHERDVLHGDLKPDNILLARDVQVRHGRRHA